jgi:hypothetical protein
MGSKGWITVHSKSVKAKRPVDTSSSINTEAQRHYFGNPVYRYAA